MAAILTFLRSLYDLDTLDTRFTNPATVPYKTVVDARKDDRDAKSSKERAASWNLSGQPSKWKTPEFFLYYIYVAIAMPAMFYIPYTASKCMWQTPSSVLAGWSWSKLLLTRAHCDR